MWGRPPSAGVTSRPAGAGFPCWGGWPSKPRSRAQLGRCVALSKQAKARRISTICRLESLWLGFNHFAAAQAGRAHTDPLGRRPHLCVNRTEVDVPAPFAHVVGMADGVPELRPLAADITDSCHNLLTLLGLMPKHQFYRLEAVPPSTTAAVGGGRNRRFGSGHRFSDDASVPFPRPLRGRASGQLKRPCP